MASYDLLKNHVHKIRVPQAGEKVYKDECVFSFDTPETETGLFVCMNTFLGVGKKYLETFYRKTGNAVYFHIKRTKKEISQESGNGGQVKPVKMAIGVAGGFTEVEKKYEYEETHTIVILPEYMTIPLPNVDLPENGERQGAEPASKILRRGGFIFDSTESCKSKMLYETVQVSIACILASEPALKVEEAQASAGTWEGEKLEVSKYAASLVQLDNGVKIPPHGWKCQDCNLTDNLWLNLTDGAILCGRKYFDGSGGNNHALHHYQKTGYPLVVKLGTITADGTADVYSYEEDNMVLDPDLPKHLSHFGINIASMSKTDKSMAELEIDLNQHYGEWAVLQESDSKLTPLFGPGYTGMANLGNSCYMNSVLQVLFSLPPFIKRYYQEASTIFENSPEDPTKDFNTQMAKVACGLLSGNYSKPPPNDVKPEEWQSQQAIRPAMFKALVGRGHPEFSSKRQQDAQEFMLHILDLLEKNNRGQKNPAESFRFLMEERLECGSSHMVSYTTRVDYMLSLPLPLEAAINKDEVLASHKLKEEKIAQGIKLDSNFEVVRPLIPLEACLQSFASHEKVEDFYSTGIGAKTSAIKTTRLASFPDYLVIHLKKFTIGDDWVPKKLDVAVQVPQKLDLGWLRGKGMQEGEVKLPEPSSEPQEFHFDQNMLQQLCEMGFPEEGCKRALYHTSIGAQKGETPAFETVMNWVMDHMEDPDFGEPFLLPHSKTGKAPEFKPEEVYVEAILNMGFTRAQAIRALKATSNDLERAADWIFSHADELDQEEMDTSLPPSSLPNKGPSVKDGQATYELMAFISHMGTSSLSGHYVCHINREGRWVIYNDSKVSLSEKPPRDLAYLYVYKRQ